MKPLLGCIGDDTTGSTDLANNLVRAGMRTVQTIGVPSRDLTDPCDAVVVALKSRTNPASEAVEQSLAALEWLRKQGVQQVYFKYCSTFDSTPAGNIGPVTEALMDALGAPFTIACPAFPVNQRTVFLGHLFVGNQLLSDSGMRNHPLTPMTDSNLVRVLQAQTKRKVGLVPYDVVARGPDAIRASFERLQAEGVGIAILDAVSDEDLMRIGPALAGMPLVTAGSGIAIGLPQNWRARGHLGAPQGADRLPAATGLQAVVSGSCSIATQAQVLEFRRSGRPAYAVDPLAIAAGDDVAAAALAELVPHLTYGPVLAYATADAAQVRAVQERLGVERAGALVEQTLARIAVGFVEAGVRQLVVAGGETAGAAVQALGIEQLVIGPQIDPGVPWTAAASPVAGGTALHAAFKSGNFGAPDFFTRAFRLLGS